jgi:hypothetical protein
MTAKHKRNLASIKIRIGSTMRVDYNTALRAWFHSDDGLSWTRIPRVTNAQAAINYAVRYYCGRAADNQE